MRREAPLTAHPWLVGGAFGSARLLFPLARSSKPTSGIAPLTTTFTCTGMVTPCPWWLECVNTLPTTSRRNPRPGAFGDPVSMPPTPTLRLRPNPPPPRQPGGACSTGSGIVNCVGNMDNDDLLGPGDSVVDPFQDPDPPEGFATWEEYQ